MVPSSNAEQGTTVICVPPCVDLGPSRAELRRARVQDTARKLFIENGFHATGMAQIAKESGIAVGQIYRDFSCKEDIVAALVEADCGRLMMYESLDEALRRGDRGVVRGWLREFIEPGDMEDARLFAEILAESSRNDRIAAIFRSLQEELRRRILSALELLVPGHAQADRRSIMADAVMTLSLGVFQHQLLRPQLDVPRLVRALDSILDRELSAAQG